MKKVPKYSPEFRERAVRLVFEHQGEHKTQWAAIVSIASKIGCTSETLRRADLRTVADHPSDLLRAQGARGGAGAIAAADSARSRDLRPDSAHLG
jgi:transposase